MHKGKLLAIFIATAFLVVGGVFLGIALKNNYFAGTYEDNSYVIEEAFTNIKVDSDIADVYFKVAEDGKTTVETHLYENSIGSAKVVDGVLVIKEKEQRIWYKSLFVFGQKDKVTIYLPLSAYNDLNVVNDTGNFVVPAGFTFNNVNIDADTGDIKFRANVNELLNIKVDTGDILLDNISVKNLKVKTHTGDVKLNKVVVAEDIIEIRTGTGDVNYVDVTCVNLTQNSGTGHSKLTRVTASGKMDITTDTGYVKFLNIDAGEVKIETDTGDVKGNFLTDKVVFAESDTGKVKIPMSNTGGMCDIKTDTGDIIITIGEK